MEEISNLFLEFAEHEYQLEFPVLYAIGREGIAGFETSENPDHSLTITDAENLSVLFETILKEVPAPRGSTEGGFQMQITNLSSDSHKGIYAIGKVGNGILKKNGLISVVRNREIISKGRAEYIFTYNGLKKEEITETLVGDIIAITGASDVKIGDTITDPEHPMSLPHLSIAEPTIQIEMSVSNSPFVGRDGDYVTSRQIGERLRKELETNVGLRLSPDDSYRNDAPRRI
ncbi:MAG: GTP-binding protein TypA/BipA [Candidatus Roizmanbacteria bacterium GW2011_GWA1_41_13]|uniref:GTP-binding protein TypA/BipA n=1 Tax=Candidatus Roizmanbacteria bacterium GW2011_GWA1_41_13 TaxID=1618474 RepID=A0A0G0V3G7_9BACT|nr:MAG: GTP-binding protein TypA/BipA [Candidatus Roizmanbacteria bacterium GW2011_GWA1_41_13]